MLETKDYIALGIMLFLIPVGSITACFSQRARDVMFFLMVVAAVIPDRLDVNFMSHFWYYRGTTRGFEVSIVDILAICLLVAAVFFPQKGQNRFFWPASLTFLLFYFFYCCVSVVISEPKIFGAFEMTKVFRSVLIFLAAAYYVRSERELKILIWALASVVCYEGALAVKQRYIDGIHRVIGSVYHPNSLSMYLCLAAPILVAASLSNLPRHLRYFCVVALGAAAAGIVLTISRAGLPIFMLVCGGAALFSMRWVITRRKIIGAVAVAAAMALLISQAWDNIMDRFGSATLEEEYLQEGNEGRGHYLRLAGHIVRDHAMGVGLGNWSYAVSKTYGKRVGINYYLNYDELMRGPEPSRVESFNYAPPAHNLAALTAGELGIPGLILFALIWIRWFHMGVGFLFRKVPEAMHRVGVGLFFGTVGVFLQSLTEWTYRQTPIILTFHLLLGAMASLYYHRRKEKKRKRRQSEETQDEENWQYEDEDYVQEPRMR